MLLGVDTGGTFTDFVLADASGLRFHKELSTPDDPFRAIARGIRALGLNGAELHLVHGSTVATNAILERKGARVLFVTNAGFEDLLRIGRQTRPALYELCPTPGEPWLARDDCIGVHARCDAEGRVLCAPKPQELEHLARRAADYDAIAVCLLFSFLHGAHEQAIAHALPADKFVSLSHRILPEYGEFERASTTFLNAYVGPLVQRYLARIAEHLAPRHLFIMHSAGGVMDAERAGQEAVRLVLSGPAGGLVAAAHVGAMLDIPRALTFDMGGTSTDVALLDGQPHVSNQGSIAGMPVAVPMMDIHTIGAGGGSIAWIDEAGLPRIGPASAGAQPGPACYGLGGKEATVTDANLVLGHLPANTRLAGQMPLRPELAQQACAAFGRALGLDAVEAARAIVDLANEQMLGALRVVSVQRGLDPAAFTLFCFGGAGGLHACALAESLDMRRIILPLASGAFSALGMIVGKRQLHLSQSRRMRLDAPDTQQRLETLFHELERRAQQQLPGLTLHYRRSVDMRYAGQGFHLNLPWQRALDTLGAQFAQAHAQSYGHTLAQPIEIMTARLIATADTPTPAWQALPRQTMAPQPVGHSQVHAVGRVPHYRRDTLGAGAIIDGPALLLEDTSTFWLQPGWRIVVHRFGHLIAERKGEGR
ncbi:MAG: hydantoinase/oxoprolinase family protein [Zetaproteobacteria bacterium]|nr:MAG: hydantoinase/oxoprolinase family protein [Zetaproteobacteria bacterium]